MSNWSIVLQDVWQKGELVGEAEIRQILKYPATDEAGNPIIDPETGLQVFRPIAGFVLRLLYSHKATPNDVWKVIFTRWGYNVTCPERQEFVNRLPTDKTKETVPGRAIDGDSKTGSMGPRKFLRWIKDHVGIELGEYIFDLFQREIAANETAKAEKAAAKRAKAEKKLQKERRKLQIAA